MFQAHPLQRSKEGNAGRAKTAKTVPAKDSRKRTIKGRSVCRCHRAKTQEPIRLSLPLRADSFVVAIAYPKTPEPIELSLPLLRESRNVQLTNEAKTSLANATTLRSPDPLLHAPSNIERDYGGLFDSLLQFYQNCECDYGGL